MPVDVAVVQQAPLLEVVHDFRVCVLHELARKGIIAGYDALQVHRLHKVQPLLAAQPQVLVTEGRGDVDDAGAVFHGYEVGGYDPGGVSALFHRLQHSRLEPADS